MAISYSKVNWDTSKYVNPTNMNQMDNGIKSACDGVDTINGGTITGGTIALTSDLPTTTTYTFTASGIFLAYKHIIGLMGSVWGTVCISGTFPENAWTNIGSIDFSLAYVLQVPLLNTYTGVISGVAKIETDGTVSIYTPSEIPSSVVFTFDFFGQLA